MGTWAMAQKLGTFGMVKVSCTFDIPAGHGWVVFGAIIQPGTPIDTAAKMGSDGTGQYHMLCVTYTDIVLFTQDQLKCNIYPNFNNSKYIISLFLGC